MTFRRIFTRLRYGRYGRKKAFGGFLQKAFTRKYLLYTNVFLSSSISYVGDLLEQTYEYTMKEIEKYDFNRTAHMAFSGAIAGVICHNWYRVLDKVIIGQTVDMVIKKVLLDQFICSPIVIMSFFATVAIFEDNPWESFTDEVSEKFITLYKAEWVVWPPAQIINFYFMPLRFRVLYDNTISLGYDVYTSHVKHAKTIMKHTDGDKSNDETSSTNHKSEVNRDDGEWKVKTDKD